nr:hypothetical protein CFP56_45608 [Quercus suber]
MEVSTDPVVRRVHSASPATVQVQPLDVTDSRVGVQTHSNSLNRDYSQLGEGGESVHETCDLAEVQAPCLNPVPPAVQREYLENQIDEIDHGLSCFDTNNGEAPTGVRLNVITPTRQDVRSELAPSSISCDTNLNCFSAPNNSLVVSGDVSDLDSLSGGASGKVQYAKVELRSRCWIGLVVYAHKAKLDVSLFLLNESAAATSSQTG